jgi:molybdopterin adenylyltransferase
MEPVVVSVNISERKGTIKVPVKEIELTETGVMGDAHSVTCPEISLQQL